MRAVRPLQTARKHPSAITINQQPEMQTYRLTDAESVPSDESLGLRRPIATGTCLLEDAHLYASNLIVFHG